MSEKNKGIQEDAINIQKQLFVGPTIRLDLINLEIDSPVISQWSHDPEYLSLLEVKPIRPSSPGEVLKHLESIEKEMEENKNLYYFTIRSIEDDRLLGFASIRWIEWTHGTAWIHLGIGDRNDWCKGYGSEALDLLLEYAFTELNLYRVGAEIIEYNEVARRLFEKAGFLKEVCRRKALSRDGQRWDILLYGLLHQEWEARKS